MGSLLFTRPLFTCPIRGLGQQTRCPCCCFLHCEVRTSWLGDGREDHQKKNKEDEYESVERVCISSKRHNRRRPPMSNNAALLRPSQIVMTTGFDFPAFPRYLPRHILSPISRCVRHTKDWRAPRFPIKGLHHHDMWKPMVVTVRRLPHVSEGEEIQSQGADVVFVRHNEGRHRVANDLAGIWATLTQLCRRHDY